MSFTSNMTMDRNFRSIVHEMEMDVINYSCYFENKIIAQTHVLQESLVA